MALAATQSGADRVQSLATACACATLGMPTLVPAAEADLGPIDQLVRAGRYQEAYSLLAPMQPAGTADDALYC